MGATRSSPTTPPEDKERKKTFDDEFGRLKTSTNTGSESLDHDGFLDSLFEDAWEDTDGVYNFEEFIKYFKMTPFNKFGKNVKAMPEISWYDPDIALRERAELFKSHEPEVIDAVKNAVKQVNRWNFTIGIVKSGEYWMSCSLALQMKIMCVLGELVNFKQTKLRLLDAGCGSGYLLATWAARTPSDAEIWGLEVDNNTLIHARDTLFHRMDTFSCKPGSSEHKQIIEKIRVVKGDVKRMVAGSSSGKGLDDFVPFPAEYFDAVNVGVAMPIEPRMEECVKEGGFLLMPTIDHEDAHCPGKEHERGDAQFTVYRKQDSKLVPFTSVTMPGATEACTNFNVKFVKRKTLSPT